MAVRELVVPTGSRHSLLALQPQGPLQVEQLRIRVWLSQTPFGTERHQSSFEGEWPRSSDRTGLNVRRVLEKGQREQYWLGRNSDGLNRRPEET